MKSFKVSIAGGWIPAFAGMTKWGYLSKVSTDCGDIEMRERGRRRPPPWLKE
jgi:hypothetical protein